MKTLSTVLLFIAMFAIQSANAENPSSFRLQSALSDEAFDLKSNQGKTVVLHFLLKTECPYCLRYTNDYARLAATTPEVVHLFIKPDTVDEIKSWAGNLDQSNPAEQPKIYRDPGAKLAKQFGIPDGYKFHGQSVHFPALVVLNGDGKEMFRYVGKNNGDRMSTGNFAKKLQSTVTN